MRLFISRFKGSEDYLRAKYLSNLVRVPIAQLNLNIYLLVCGIYHGCADLNVFIIEELLMYKEVYNCLLCVADSDLAVKP